MPESPMTAASVSWSDQLRNLPQYLLPQRGLTRLIHWATRVQAPWFKDALIRWFIGQYQVDLSEALEPNPTAYRNFNGFFTRALKLNARPLAVGERVICCPVDGTVSQMGVAADDVLVQAKGRSFSLTALLGGDSARAQPFQGGAFTTLYLSPRDYHRIHMPLAGQLREMIHIPGKLFSVSPLTTRVVPDLFARNERVAALFDTEAGPMAVVLVGAINVASIETVWAGTVTPPLGTTIRHWTYPATGEKAVSLAKGDELGRFNMGSTVILLFGPDAVNWESTITADTVVRMGQHLGVHRAVE